MFFILGFAISLAATELYNNIQTESSESLPRPVARLPKEYSLRLLRFPGGFQLEGTAIEFEKTPSGQWQRAKTSSFNHQRDSGKYFHRTAKSVRCSKLNGPSVDDEMGRMIMNWILNDPASRVEHQALQEMHSRKYIDSDRLDKGWEMHRAINPGQMYYFETLSWMSAAEAVRLFGGTLPMARVAEMRGPPDLSLSAIRKLAEQGTPGVDVRIRRSTLRMTADSGWDEGATKPFRSHLPWERDEVLGRAFALDRTRSPMNFEFSRASQVPRGEAEAIELLRMAALVAVAHMNEYPVYGHAYMPANSVGVYLHSLKGSNTYFYEKKLGFKSVVSLDDNTLMQTALADLLANINAGQAHEGLDTVRKAFNLKPGSADAVQTSSWILHLINQMVTSPMEISWRGQSLTPSGPITLHREVELRDLQMRLPNASQQELLDLTELMNKLDRPITDRTFQDRGEPFIGDLWQPPPSKKNIFLSGFNKYEARNPNYFLQVLMAMNKLNLDWLKGAIWYFSLYAPELQDQAHQIGLNTFITVQGVEYYRLTTDFFPALLKPQNRHLFQDLEINPNRWDRQQRLRDVPSI